MSKILRRPMFRGGRVESRGTGITSGLANGGRAGYAAGGPTITGSELLNLRAAPDFQNALFQSKGVRSLSELLYPNTASRGFAENLVSPVDSSVAVNKNIDNIFGGYQEGDDQPDAPMSFRPGGIFAQPDVDSEENDPSSDKFVPYEPNKITGPGIVPPNKPTILSKPTEVETPKVNADDNEVTMTDLEKALGLESARQNDLGDILAAISASALKRPGRGEKRGLTDVLGDVMSSKAVTDPSRTERIKGVAGLEKYKQEKAIELAEIKARKSREYAPGNAQKNYEFFYAQTGDKELSMRLAQKQPRNFEAAFIEQRNKGNITPNMFDILARANNIDPIPGDPSNIDIDKLELEKDYYLPNTKTLIKIVEVKGVRQVIKTPYGVTYNTNKK